MKTNVNITFIFFFLLVLIYDVYPFIFAFLACPDISVVLKGEFSKHT